MLRQATYFLALIIVLLAIFVAVERTSSPFFQGCINNQQNANANSAAKDEPSSYGTILASYVACSGRFIEGHGVGITALATFIIAAFTGTLWLATSQQAQLTREAFIADKRAFVFAKGLLSFYEPGNAGQFNWRLAPVWENSGDTPTRGMQIYTDCLLSNSRMPATFDFTYTDPASPPGPGLLGPKMPGTGGQAPHFPSAAITPQDILDIQGNRKFLYLWGWARYSDILPNTPRRITRFCWQIFVAGDPLAFNPSVDPQSIRFSNVHQARGNCADDECVLQGLG
ncbi:MAG: hypothetical protein ABSA90_17535 [Xanthobacteraceae bacterium]|jgi:hypothetical protein